MVVGRFARHTEGYWVDPNEDADHGGVKKCVPSNGEPATVDLGVDPLNDVAEDEHGKV